MLGRDAIRKLDISIQGNALKCASIYKDADILPADLRNEFGHLFSGHLGLAKGFAHKVPLKPDVKPVAA